MPLEFLPSLVVRTPLRAMKSSFNEDELIEFFLQDSTKEALFVSSSSLIRELDKYQKGEFFDAKRKEKLRLSLLKFALRMHNRSTPFGLFSGCGTIKFSNKNDIFFENCVTRKTNLDTAVMCRVIQKINNISALKDKLLYFPNNSILELRNKIRYTEFSYLADKREYNVISVDRSFYLEKILDLSEKGITINELVNSLSFFGIERENIVDFIELLIQNQILVSELEFSLTEEEESLKAIVHKLNSYLCDDQELNGILKLLESLYFKLKILDSNKYNDTSLYTDISDLIEIITNEPSPNNFVHVETVVRYNEEFSIDEQIQNQILQSIEILHRLDTSSEARNLKEFKLKFSQRYEDQEIPLLVALDPEIGIGYGLTENNNSGINPIVDDLFVLGSEKQDEFIGSNKRLDILKKILISSIKSGEYSVDLLSEGDIIHLDKTNLLPHSFSVVFQLLKDGLGNDLILLNYTGGSSAANILGRFTSDFEIGSLVTDIFREESRLLGEDVLLSEIIHLPQDRVGNVVRRYKSREWEIPYLSKSSVDYNHQIQLSDILISIKDGVVLLRSKKQGKIILPRLCNFHNYINNSLPIYNFLCDLQFQGCIPGLYLSLTDLGLDLPFFPRVTVGNVIVSRATWCLKEKEIKMLSKASDQKEIENLLKELKLPVMFFLIEGDNELLIDTRNNLSLALFKSEIKSSRKVILKENLYQKPNTSVICNGEGDEFSNEFIASVINNSDGLPKIFNLQKKENEYGEKVERTFFPGSEWLYFKIYCGSHTSDEILTEIIRDVSSNLLNEGLIKKWFYIRYSDPENHLRIRFNLISEEMVGEVMNTIKIRLNEFVESGMVWSIQLDTYKREVERYGANTIILSEELFYRDSIAVVEFLNILSLSEDEPLLIKFALQGIYDLLDVFNRDIEEKVSLIESLRISFFNEFGSGEILRKGLDQKVRFYRNELDNLRKGNLFQNNEDSIVRILDERKRNFKLISNELDKILLNNKFNNSSKKELTYSYIHMFVNRLFNNKQRLHELVLYTLLTRLYKTEQITQKTS